MENNKYWTEFYKEGKQLVTTPSPFARWFIHNAESFGLKANHTVLDLGAGVGRDTKFLSQFFRRATGIDANNTTELVDKLTLKESLRYFENYDIIYSRFFLHCLGKKEIVELIGNIKKHTFFVAEFRVQGDKPVLYTDHKRHFVDMVWLLSILINSGFEIKFSQVSRDLAPFKEENPLIGRVVAYKKNVR